MGKGRGKSSYSSPGPAPSDDGEGSVKKKVETALANISPCVCFSCYSGVGQGRREVGGDEVICSHLGPIVQAMIDRGFPVLRYRGDGTLLGWHGTLHNPSALADVMLADPLPAAGRPSPSSAACSTAYPGPEVKSVASTRSYLPYPSGPPTTYAPGAFCDVLTRAADRRARERILPPPPPRPSAPWIRDPRCPWRRM